MPPDPQSKRRLIVEGSDDKHSIIHLLSRHGVNWEGRDVCLPWVHVADTDRKALDAFESGMKSFERYGLVIDADVSPLGRWAQVHDRLKKQGLYCPDNPDPSGTIVRGLRPEWRVGIWLMPDNRESGILEDFLSKLVPADDPCWSYARDVTIRARTEYNAPLDGKDLSKGCLYTWLAWQRKPGMPFGTALTAGSFDHDLPEALRFVHWFKRLFFDG